jgi:hypothetical protein
MNIPIDDYDCTLIHSILVKGLQKAEKQLESIRRFVAKEVDRSYLPDTLKHLPPEEIEQQIDPWRSMVSHYQTLVDTFAPLVMKAKYFER